MPTAEIASPSLVAVRPVRSGRDWKAFLDLPRRLYASDPHWVAPLDAEIREMLSDKNPFWAHAERETLLAYKEGRVAGRIVATWDHLYNETQNERAGLFGFFECENDPAVAAALVDAACAWLKAKGAVKVMGPFSPSINDECGLLVDGFDGDPFIMEPHNPPYYADLLEAAGFSKAKDLWSWIMDDVSAEVPRVAKLAERVHRRPGLVLRTLDMRHFDRDIQLIREIFNDSWRDNWAFAPITPEEIAFTAKKLKAILKPEIVHFIEIDGKPAAMSVGLQDVNKALKPINGKLWPFGLVRLLWGLRSLDQGRLIALGVRKEHRNKGLEALLYHEAVCAGRKLGWKRGEMGWTLEDNRAINEGIRAMGGRVHRTYRILSKDLA